MVHIDLAFPLDGGDTISGMQILVRAKESFQAPRLRYSAAVIGTTIAHYRITAKLGEGGMGEVYRATDERLQREVAIKLLPEAVEQSPERLARFRREAQLLAALSHGNIAAIYGIEEQGGRAAIVLELVEGETLQERITRGPLPLDDVREIALQIALAVEAAHEKGIVHRDLKPANVKITPEGTVKVLDFGLAKALAPEAASGEPAQLSQSPTITSTQTRDGVILGTAAYMSPEQARGKQVDRRADIWAFGCVLYEMLAGKSAFAADTVSDTLVAILSKEADFDALPGSTPPALHGLLNRCLDKDPRRRLRDVGEARVVLEDADSFVARNAATPGGSRKGLAAATVTVAVVAFLAGWALRSPAEAPQNEVEYGIRRLTFDPGLEHRPAISPDGNYVVYVTNREGNLDLEMLPLAGGGVRRLTTSPADDAQPNWSPDGTQLAFVSAREREQPMLVSAGGLGNDSQYVYSEGGDIFVMPALGGPATKLVDRGAYPTWSPDGKSIAFQSNRSGQWRIWRVSSSGGEPEQLTGQEDGDRYEFHPVWSPDGRWVAFGRVLPGGPGRGLVVVPSAGGAVIEVHTGSVVTPAWSADGEYLYFGSSHGSQDGRHNLWRVAFDPEGPPGRAERVTFSADSDVEPSISADGRRIVFSQIDFTAGIWSLDLASGALEKVTRGSALESYPHLNPDGRRLLFNGDRSGSTKIWVHDLIDGTSQVLPTPGEASLGRWSPDGGHIAYSAAPDNPNSSGKVAIQRWGETTRQIFDGPGDNHSVGLQWSPDGKRLVGGASAEITSLWVHTPGEESRLLVENGSFGTWSPDGQWIAYQRDAGRDHREVWVVPAAGGEERMIVGGDVHLSHPQWHPTDPDVILVVIDHLDLGLVHVADGTLERITRLASSTTLVDYPSWSPDGKTIYFNHGIRRGDLYLLEELTSTN